MLEKFSTACAGKPLLLQRELSECTKGYCTSVISRDVNTKTIQLSIPEMISWVCMFRGTHSGI